MSTGNCAAGAYAALDAAGRTDDERTSIGYDSATGEIWIDVPIGRELTSINMDSATGIFVGQPAAHLNGTFDIDTDTTVLKATFGGSFGTFTLVGQRHVFFVHVILRERAPKRSFGRRPKDLLWLGRFFSRRPTPTLLRSVPGRCPLPQNDTTCGQVVFCGPLPVSRKFDSLSFGSVARRGLTEEFLATDLTIVGSLSGGGDLGPVSFLYTGSPPTIPTIPDQSLDEDTPTEPIPFTVDDLATSADSLIVTASSDNYLKGSYLARRT